MFTDLTCPQLQVTAAVNLIYAKHSADMRLWQCVDCFLLHSLLACAKNLLVHPFDAESACRWIKKR